MSGHAVSGRIGAQLNPSFQKVGARPYNRARENRASKHGIHSKCTWAPLLSPLSTQESRLHQSLLPILQYMLYMGHATCSTDLCTALYTASFCLHIYLVVHIANFLLNFIRPLPPCKQLLSVERISVSLAFSSSTNKYICQLP